MPPRRIPNRERLRESCGEGPIAEAGTPTVDVGGAGGRGGLLHRGEIASGRCSGE